MASDSDSDDAVLNLAPTFSQKKRKKDEDKMLSYLQDCYEAQEERHKRKQRMEEMIRDAAAAANKQKDADEYNMPIDDNDPPGYRGDGGVSGRTPCNDHDDDDGDGDDDDDGKNKYTSQLLKNNDASLRGNEEYWEKINRIANEGGSAEKARRRRRLDDAMDGVDLSYTQDNMDDDDDLGGGGSSSRLRKVGLATAKATGLSVDLGVRRVFFPSRARRGKDGGGVVGGFFPKLFCSMGEAIEDLENIMDDFWENRTFSVIMNVLEKVCKRKRIAIFLHKRQLLKMSRRNQLMVPDSFKMWLWRVACSGERVTRTFCEGARCTFLDIVVRDEIVVVNLNPDSEGVFYVVNLLPGLESLYGLTQIDEEKGNCNKHCDDECSSEGVMVDALGVKHYLELWNTVIQNNQERWDDCATKDSEKRGKKKAALEIAAKCLSGLIRCSLDPTFHSGQKYTQRSLDELIITLLQTVERQLSSEPIVNYEQTTEHKVRDWIHNTAEGIMLAISQFSTGLKGSADEDDISGCFPVALAIQTIPTTHPRTQAVIPFAVALKACTAEYALRRCLHNVSNDQFNTLLKQQHESWSVSLTDVKWRSLALAEIGMAHVDANVTIYLQDGPRFHAVFKIASSCAELGKSCFATQNHTQQQQRPTTIYGEDADRIVTAMHSLENHCLSTRKNVKSVIVQPHLRRVKEYLTWLSVYYRHCKLDAKGKSKGAGEKLQKTLTSFLGDGTVKVNTG